ncbi:52 kDa repressor of the inhibitor of the protein kinase-like [Corticium candelabrum]|uniref:52 kDa repressor of the inhibitor of the protein kinase-like n=1 Tax=Corticium candelabrum TaxID=121492 RepID=UPI002E26F7ED|nr:52 kDa repressor of the inhibitor of the protein kinase-like [Corticium candelabrum]
MRGQCYDGASNMSGARSGCSAVIQQQAPKAAYFHCDAHRLNLAAVSACKIQAFVNVEAYIGESARFFAFSPKRQRLFDKTMDKFLPKAKARKLKDACRTRRVQRIDSYTVFLELLPALHTSLQAMVSPGQHKDFGTDWGWDGNTITKANGYLYQLQSPSFLVCFKILLEILQCLKGLTGKLRMQASDVMYAYKQVQSVRLILQKMREDCVQEFNKIFAESLKLGQDLHGEDFVLTKPCIARRQSHRSNIETCNAEQYYGVTMYNEFLSHVIRELDNRFSGNQYLVHGLLHLVPSKVASESHDDFPETLSQAADYFKDDLPHHNMLSIEYRMWVRKWKCSDEVPTKLVDALKSCDEIQFPNIFVLLKLTLTLPVTTCECERSFSQLILIKTCRRSTMTDDRLNGLAIMKIK